MGPVETSDLKITREEAPVTSVRRDIPTTSRDRSRSRMMGGSASCPPLIAITGGYDRATRSDGWAGEAVFVPGDYTRAVEGAGAIPLVIPPSAGALANAEALLAAVDGILLTGGWDIAPAHYGQDPHTETESPDADRDVLELELARGAIERDIPVLGICRGMQLINVVTGGTLHQHLPEVVGHEEHRRDAASFDRNRHDVRLERGSRVARWEAATVLDAASHHHQGIDALGAGLTVTGWAPDGLPEAVELADHPFFVGVQWHPEVDPRTPLVRALVSAATTQRSRVLAPSA